MKKDYNCLNSIKRQTGSIRVSNYRFSIFHVFCSAHKIAKIKYLFLKKYLPLCYQSEGQIKALVISVPSEQRVCDPFPNTASMTLYINNLHSPCVHKVQRQRKMMIGKTNLSSDKDRLLFRPTKSIKAKHPYKQKCQGHL